MDIPWFLFGLSVGLGFIVGLVGAGLGWSIPKICVVAMLLNVVFVQPFVWYPYLTGA